MGYLLNRQVFKRVTAPDVDWVVIYDGYGSKVWEGHDCSSEALSAVLNKLNTDLEDYEFTDPDEIDGETPTDFANIKGLKKWQ